MGGAVWCRSVSPGEIVVEVVADRAEFKRFVGWIMAEFAWHSDAISRETPISDTSKPTQNLRRFMALRCGDHFKFDRQFMAWIRNGTAKTMGDVVDEWHKRHS